MVQAWKSPAGFAGLFLFSTGKQKRNKEADDHGAKIPAEINFGYPGYCYG